MTVYTRHPVSEIFPDMGEKEFAEFVADIKEHGLHEPIRVLGTQIIDGWHRYQACLELEIEPVFKPVSEEEDLLEFSLSYNRFRRHITGGQDVTVQVLVNEIREEMHRPKAGDTALTAQEIADRTNTSRSTVQRAKKGIGAGYAREMVSGELTPAEAARKAEEDATSPAEQNQPPATQEPPAEPPPKRATYGELEKKCEKLGRDYGMMCRENEILRRKTREQEDKIQALELEGLSAGDQGAKLTEKNETIRTLEASVNKWQSQCTEEKRERIKLQRRLDGALQRISGLEADLKELS